MLKWSRAAKLFGWGNNRVGVKDNTQTRSPDAAYTALGSSLPERASDGGTRSRTHSAPTNVPLSAAYLLACQQNVSNQENAKDIGGNMFSWKN